MSKFNEKMIVACAIMCTVWIGTIMYTVNEILKILRK